MKNSSNGPWRNQVYLAIGLLAGGAFPGTADDAPPVLPEGGHGIATRYPADRGMEGDPQVLFHHDFESGNLEKWDNYWQKVDTRIVESFLG